MANYKCPALGDCERANKGEIFERTPGEELRCPTCGTTLEAVARPGTKKNPGDDGGKGIGTPVIAAIAAAVVIVVGGGAYFYLHAHRSATVVPPVASESAPAPVSASAPVVVAAASAPATAPAAGLAPDDAEIARQSQAAAGQLASGSASDALADSKGAAAKEMIKVAVADMKQGKLDEAEHALNDALAQDPKQSLAYYNLGVLRLRQGNTDEALKQFEASFLNGFNYFDAMDKDPDLNGIRNDPRFTALVKKYRAPAV
ncbi:tetratricopeptide repeat protein [Paraburkholderia caballeronis]|uniref:tetratricopeptide repeat protein n=1 Tax=Paraburkholderia caballeronis TaxID=416943 RepID=UPI0010652DB0|nr:tetratricopeptide repeat protein [Paraburkholderia caballeronis]TDV37349.1 tetratricopeptide repeat protein [Paraburkholderia caballeronis]